MTTGDRAPVSVLCRIDLWRSHVEATVYDQLAEGSGPAGARLRVCTLK
jgi:hypothetical protein